MAAVILWPAAGSLTLCWLCPANAPINIGPPPPLGAILEVKCCQIPYQSPPVPVQGVVGPNIDRCIDHPNTIPSSYDQEPHNPHINSSQDLPPPISTQPALSMQPASEIPMLVVQSLHLKGMAHERQVLNL